MKKTMILTLLLAVTSFHLWAQYTLSSTRRMSPGVVYKKYTSSSPAQNISVMELDLSEPTLRLQVVKSSGKINGNPQTVSTMYADHDNFAYHDVTAAVNGDFFTSNETYKNPRHMMIEDGEILWDTVRNQSVFGITENNTPFIEKLSGSYSVTANGNTFSFNQINRNRGTNQMVLYNRFIGNTTGTASGGTEVKIVPLDGVGGWKANATISCKVLAKSGAGNMSFAAGEAVLSGVGTAKAFLDNLNVNDNITLNLQVLPSTSGISGIKQLCGGYPKIVAAGANYATQGMAEEGSPVGTQLAPRTAVGFNQAGNKIYLVAVDGRDPGVSEGMTLSELADFMVYIGSYRALNLDGGGSTTMVGNAELKNNPSDGSERLTSNAILAYLTSLTLDDFENGVGHFNRAPTYSSATVGVSTSSVLTQALTAHSGNYSLIAKLYDDPANSSPWSVRILSGSGEPSNNRYFAGTGTISLWLKTSTAASNPKIRLRLDDNDGTEISPKLNIINDGQWHKYSWSLSNFNGSSTDGGNGVINSSGARLDAIEFTQDHSTSTWFIFMDDLMVDKNSTATAHQVQSLKKQNVLELPSVAESNSTSIVYPNPANDYLYVDLNKSEVTQFDVEIIDLSGKTFYSGSFSGNKQAISVQDFPPGIYLTRIAYANTTESFKILIQ